jgi:hypothetical protein
MAITIWCGLPARRRAVYGAATSPADPYTPPQGTPSRASAGGSSLPWLCSAAAATLVLDGSEHLQRGVSALPVVEDLEVLEERGGQFQAGAPRHRPRHRPGAACPGHGPRYVHAGPAPHAPTRDSTYRGAGPGDRRGPRRRQLDGNRHGRPMVIGRQVDVGVQDGRPEPMTSLPVRIRRVQETCVQPLLAPRVRPLTNCRWSAK